MNVVPASPHQEPPQGDPQPTLVWSHVKDISYVGGCFYRFYQSTLRERSWSCKWGISIYRKSGLNCCRFWQMTPSGSTTFSIVLPLTIDCANKYVDSQSLHLRLPLHVYSRGVIPSVCLWEFAAACFSWCRMKTPCFLSGGKNRKAWCLDKLIG